MEIGSFEGRRTTTRGGTKEYCTGVMIKNSGDEALREEAGER